MTTPGTDPTRDQSSLVRTLPGRLFILSSALLLMLLVLRQFSTVPEFLQVFRSVLRLAWVVSLVWLGVLAVARQSGRFLWRVRQKLILSYVFLGFVPVLLVASLALVGGLVLYFNVAAYMFHEGFADVADDVNQIAETAAAEVGRAPGGAMETIARKYLTSMARYPLLSLAVVGNEPLAADAPATAPPAAIRPLAAGPWKHAPAPAEVPVWLRNSTGGFRGVVAAQTGETAGVAIVIRSAVPTADASRVVVVDLPIDPGIVSALEATTKTRMGQVSIAEVCGPTSQPAASAPVGAMFGFFRQTVAFMDCRDWSTGAIGRVSVSLDAPLSRLWAKVGAASLVAQSQVFLTLLVTLGILFLVIQGAALFFGALLARSITYAVHELFVGTERVQQGDFAHRIRIESPDQLGALAGSFNRMSASIEHGLHVQREKQRLDDELRIAREIQKSLLPQSPPVMPGLTIADLCEPAREVGGDYYDFFDLGPRQIGVMIADVSGKGTSAALYMAELKGLMLSLSHRERSPRQLMIEANRLLSAHLDNRSFITMTYMVIDLDARTLTCARAGHTPMLVVSEGVEEVVTPAGMVLGLRLPGATERFSQILEEHTRPIRSGDVYVLYTDGISEAMDSEGELFTDAGLGRVVSSHHTLDAAGIRERVVREVRAFVGDAEPHDDMTMIVVKIGDLEQAA